MIVDDCLIKLKNACSSLTFAERKIAEKVLEEPKLFLTNSVAVLAKICEVSPSTIMKMCHSLGYDGFKEFQITLAQDSSVNNTSKNISDSSVMSVFDKVFHSGVSALRDTLKMLDANLLEAIVDRLIKTRNIYFYGVGTSAPLAMDAFYRFTRLGHNSFYSDDPPIMLITASRLNSNDTAFAISHSGRTEATIDALRYAKKAGAYTIALTSHANSPICSVADSHIVIYSDEINYPVEAVSSRLAHIAVLDALCTAVSESDKSFLNNNENYREILETLRIKQ